jgi:UbiA prenyltransferase family
MLIALSLFYVGGMFLNDAFDAAFDTKARPERPIPSGQVTAGHVYAIGFCMLALGVGLLAWVGYGWEPFTHWRPVVAGVALAAAIVFYNWHHKENPLSPLVMGLCRVLVYLAAAFSVIAEPPAAVYIAAAVLLCYLIGLTYAAKKEHLDRLDGFWPLAFLAVPIVYGILLALEDGTVWLALAAFAAWTAVALRLLMRRRPGDVPRGVVSLIAGISLLDAILLAGHGAPGLAALAGVAFLLTLALQRWVSGT